MSHLPKVATLLAAATRTTAVANALGTAVADLARAKRAIVTLDVTAMAGAEGDTLDVFIDVSPDGGTTWVNAVHFPQIAGNGAACKHVAILDPSNPGTSTIDVTSDAAAGAVRPAAWGTDIRARHTLVDAGAHGQSAAFGVGVLLQ